MQLPWRFVGIHKVSGKAEAAQLGIIAITFFTADTNVSPGACLEVVCKIGLKVDSAYCCWLLEAPSIFRLPSSAFYATSFS